MELLFCDKFINSYISQKRWHSANYYILTQSSFTICLHYSYVYNV